MIQHRPNLRRLQELARCRGHITERASLSSRQASARRVQPCGYGAAAPYRVACGHRLRAIQRRQGNGLPRLQSDEQATSRLYGSMRLIPTPLSPMSRSLVSTLNLCTSLRGRGRGWDGVTRLTASSIRPDLYSLAPTRRLRA